MPCLQTGEWVWTGGDYPGASGDKGIKTSEDARFYSLTAPLDSAFDNKGKDLVLSYTVKHEQNLDCGGAYIKVSCSERPP
jgi:calreticulin